MSLAVKGVILQKGIIPCKNLKIGLKGYIIDSRGVTKIPNYDFKCHKCKKVEEGRFSFKEAEKGFPCSSCDGKMEMQFPTQIAVIGCNRFMRKKGMDA